MIAKTARYFIKSTAALVLLSAGTSSLAYAQSSDAEEVTAEEYSALLQQIEDMKVNIAQQELFLASQQEEIQSLQTQIGQVQGVVDSIDPMLDKMVAAISNEIETDLPFQLEGRYKRLGDLQDVVNDDAALPREKMRRALNIFDAEVNYGLTMDSYQGDHPGNPGWRLEACQADLESSRCALNEDQLRGVRRENNPLTYEDLEPELQDGTYLRYGRLALAYQDADGGDTFRFDPTSEEWVAVTGGRKLDIRSAVKMARGEAAVGVVQAPTYVSTGE